MERVLHPNDHQIRPINDLKQIRGIGPMMEQRLNGAGVFTFAQLANISTEELAALFSNIPGLSTERIAEKGWSNQARLLMEKEATTDIPGYDDKGQYSAVFSVDLLLDNQNRVRRTHILHVQSRKEDTWADWNKDRLVSFIFENASVRSAQKPVEESGTQTNATEIIGDLSMSDVEIQFPSGKIAHCELTANEPFTVSIVLDTSKMSTSSDAFLQYQAEIYAKNLADGKHQKVGESNGSVELKKLIPLLVNCHALSQGSYRLEACTILSPDLESTNPRSRLMAMTEGRVFRVS